MIICIEGVNGSGKTTVARLIAKQWTSIDGLSAEVIEPVQMTDFGRRVRASIMDEPTLDVVAEALAFASARLHACAGIRSTADGSPERLFILERWAGALVAYGRAAGIDPQLLRALEDSLVAALDVDHTFLLDVPGKIAADRLRGNASPNKFETRGAEYLEKVGAEYRTWAKSQEIKIIEGGSGTVNEHVGIIIAVLLATQEENDRIKFRSRHAGS